MFVILQSVLACESSNFSSQNELIQQMNETVLISVAHQTTLSNISSFAMLACIDVFSDWLLVVQAKSDT